MTLQQGRIIHNTDYIRAIFYNALLSGPIDALILLPDHQPTRPGKMAAGHRLFFKLDTADPNQNSNMHYPRIVHIQRVAA